MKAIKRERARKLDQHREVLAELRAGRVMFSAFCECCSFAWVHDSGDTLGPFQGIEKLAKESNEESYQIDPNKLTLGNELGRGGNGSVYVASYCGFPVAVKELNIRAGALKGQDAADAEKSGKTLDDVDREQELRLNAEFEKEFQNLKRIRHPHIVDLYGTAILQDVDSTSFRRVLTMELAACSLKDVLRNENSMAPMGTALNWAKEVAIGLGFLHSRGLIHFDIKSANVLIDFSGRAKICDLGVAHVTSTHSPNSLTFTNSARVGTPSYMAPELLRADVTRITNSVDVYSYGVFLWEVLHRESPHPKSWGIPQLFRQVAVNKYRPEIEADVPSAFATLIRSCWSEVPSERPACETIVKILEFLVPPTLPTLISTLDKLKGEQFYLWEAEAKCFLSDCVFHSHMHGRFNIDFSDGQPSQHGVDPRNIVLARSIQGVPGVSMAMSPSKNGILLLPSSNIPSQLMDLGPVRHDGLKSSSDDDSTLLDSEEDSEDDNESDGVEDSVIHNKKVCVIESSSKPLEPEVGPTILGSPIPESVRTPGQKAPVILQEQNTATRVTAFLDDLYAD